MGARKEADLYLPVKSYFEEQGFEVKGEVQNCDLVAIRGEQMVIAELKSSFNLTLLLQGVERQKSSDDVFLAVEAPKNPRRQPHWNEIRLLCRRLGLGLLTVTFFRDQHRVDLICPPGPYQPTQRRNRRNQIQKEFHRRTGDFNIGGRNKHPIITAYREEAILIARALQQGGPMRPKDIAQITGGTKTGTILRNNFYGWFVRVEKGIYQITPLGEEALRNYQRLEIVPEQSPNKTDENQELLNESEKIPKIVLE